MVIIPAGQHGKSFMHHRIPSVTLIIRDRPFWVRNSGMSCMQAWIFSEEEL